MVLTISSSLHSVKKCMIFSLPLLQSLQFMSSSVPICQDILCATMSCHKTSDDSEICSNNWFDKVVLFKIKAFDEISRSFSFHDCIEFKFACFSSHFLIISSKFLVQVGTWNDISLRSREYFASLSAIEFLLIPWWLGT